MGKCCRERWMVGKRMVLVLMYIPIEKIELMRFHT